MRRDTVSKASILQERACANEGADYQRIVVYGRFERRWHWSVVSEATRVPWLSAPMRQSHRRDDCKLAEWHGLSRPSCFRQSHYQRRVAVSYELWLCLNLDPGEVLGLKISVLDAGTIFAFKGALTTWSVSCCRQRHLIGQSGCSCCRLELTEVSSTEWLWMWCAR